MNIFNEKLLPPPQDYDVMAKRLGLWNSISFDQSVKRIFDMWSVVSEKVDKNKLLGVFEAGSFYVDYLPKEVFEEVKIDESPTIRMLRDMTSMAISENNTEEERIMMKNGLIKIVVATCWSGEEWNEANNWLKENGRALISFNNRLLNIRKNKKQ